MGLSRAFASATDSMVRLAEAFRQLAGSVNTTCNALDPTLALPVAVTDSHSSCLFSVYASPAMPTRSSPRKRRWAIAPGNDWP